MIYIGIFIFLLLAGNFFYRAIRLLIKINKLAFSPETTHSFACSSCSQTYTLSGPEAKKRVKGAIKITKSTPRSNATYYKFNCPQCGIYAKQQKVFDLNTTKALGAVRMQMDSNQLPLVIDFLLKGVLPILVAMPFLNLFTR